MPAFETRDRYQATALWVRTGSNQHGQDVVSPTPQTIRSRWVDSSNRVMTPEGNEYATQATVTTNLTIPMGSIMWLGALSSPSQVPTSGLFQVVDVSITPDIKNRNKRYDYKLMRYNG